MQVGIDKIDFYTPNYYLELKELAAVRNIDPDKFHIGLGQVGMSVCPPDEDVVTMAANAAKKILTDDDRQAIDTLLFATESSIDQSKAAGIYVHRLLGLNSRCSVVELKQACYGMTAAINLATGLVSSNPKRKILVIGSDVSRYGLETAGECSQGAGSVAALITANPRILAIHPARGMYSEDIMDFWRPNYRDEAFVEGKFSTEMYLKALEESWQHYHQQTAFTFSDHDFHCYHVPYPRLAEKAHVKLAEINQITEAVMQTASLEYCRLIGNTYTAALYISFISLLSNAIVDLSNKQIGFYSYGSGCVAEYFSGVVQPNYQDVFTAKLPTREKISYTQYEQWYRSHVPNNYDNYTTSKNQTGHFRFSGIVNHQRQYETL